MKAINDDFYQKEEILSRKYASGWFYSKTGTYIFNDWTLHDVCFDTEGYNDPIKLAKSILLWQLVNVSLCMPIQLITNNKSILITLDDVLLKLFLKRRTKKKFTDAEIIAGLIHILDIYPLRHLVYQIVFCILGESLGAKKLSYNGKDESTFSRKYIFGSDFRNDSINDLIESYHTNLDPLIPYIEENCRKYTELNRKSKKEAKDAVIEFLKNCSGFTQNQIDYVVESAISSSVPLRLSEFYGRRRLLDHIPHYLKPDVSEILYEDNIDLSLWENCPKCWLIDQVGMIKWTCKIHGKSTKIENNQLLEINKIEPSAPPLYDNDKIICNICMENEKDCTLIPCGHCFCYKCVNHIDNCPTCRSEFNQIQKIFV